MILTWVARDSVLRLGRGGLFALRVLRMLGILGSGQVSDEDTGVVDAWLQGDE